MNIHEHQAKELLRRYGVTTLEGQACYTVDEAVVAAERLGFPCVVKDQIHAGGRGKAGGAKAVAFLTALARAFVELDASLMEINSLVVTEGGDVVALDAKIGFDDNALFRHADVRELRDPNEEDPREREAAKFDLSYIALDGNIGCMVNGAGLAMATMDSIKAAGGNPANFLDVGGGANTEKVKAAFK